MSRGKLLSGEEAGPIAAFHRERRSNRRFAKALGRSEKAVRSFLVNQIASSARKKASRHPKLTKREFRRAFRLAIQDSLSSRQITVMLDSKPHYATVIKALHSTKFANTPSVNPGPP